MTIAELLRLPPEVQTDLASLFTSLHECRYTGSITLHFRGGVPKTVEATTARIRLSDAGSPRRPALST